MQKIVKMIKDRDYRFWVMARLGFLDKMPDNEYLIKMFRYKMSQHLDLDNPKSFNEKIQWLKLNDRKSEYANMVDKYLAKNFVSNVIGEDHIVKNYGVWDNFDEIDFDLLPNQFVLKATHDSGGLVIVRDKKTFDVEKARKKINKSLKYEFYKLYREWAYSNVKPRIIAEEYLEQEPGKGLVDYKFFCFNGNPEFLYVSEGLENHDTATISFFDLQGKLLPFHRTDYKPLTCDMKLPENFINMKNIAETLAMATTAPFVRIDLYDVKGTVYFSEITMYPNAGYIPFEPKEWDAKLGQKLIIKK